MTEEQIIKEKRTMSDYLEQLQEQQEQQEQKHRQMFEKLLDVSPDKYSNQFEKFHNFLRFGGSTFNSYGGTEYVKVWSETATIEYRKKPTSLDALEWIGGQLKLVRYIGQINHQYVYVIADQISVEHDA